MILFLDIRRDVVTLAAIAPAASGSGALTKKRASAPKNAVKWLVLKGDNKVGAALKKAQTAFGWKRKKPTAVVVAMNAPGVMQDQRNVTWSGIRQGVATANALAFAWGVPVAAVEVHGDESREALADGARLVAAKAKAGEWVRASYSAEPNITQPKKVL